MRPFLAKLALPLNMAPELIQKSSRAAHHGRLGPKDGPYPKTKPWRLFMKTLSLALCTATLIGASAAFAAVADIDSDGDGVVSFTEMLAVYPTLTEEGRQRPPRRCTARRRLHVRCRGSPRPLTITRSASGG